MKLVLWILEGGLHLSWFKLTKDEEKQIDCLETISRVCQKEIRKLKGRDKIRFSRNYE